MSAAAIRIAYAIPTWSGHRLVETIHSLPAGSRLLVIDDSQLCWPVAKAWNYALERLCGREGYDAVVILNDDVLLQPDTGQLLADALLDRQHDARLDRELLLVTGYNTRDLPDEGPRFQVGAPDYSCFCAGRRLHEICGPFDEAFVPLYFEDCDSHHRIKLAGYEAASYAPFFHFGSSTMRSDAERQAEIDRTFPDLADYYRRKWGGAPGQEKFPSPFNR